MKRLKFVTMFAAGMIALSPAVATLSNTTNTVLAAKTKKVKKRVKKHKIRKKKRQTAYQRLIKGAEKPFRTVYIDIPKSDELYQKTIDGMNGWNNTGAFTFQQTQDKSKADIIISDYDTGHLDDTDYLPDDITNGKVGYTVPLSWRSNGYVVWDFYKSHIYLDQWKLHYAMSDDDDSDPMVSTVEHELGHAIGLGHVKKTKSVMNPADGPEIQPSDVQRVKKLYNEK